MFRLHSHRGFSLTEMMVTILVTSIVMAGVVTTFNRVTRAADNASKSVDLTNSARGLASILASDFANAGRGFSDLNKLDIRFQFHEDFYEVPDGQSKDMNMYAITNFYGGTGFSEITLHWFDYDIDEDPTFFFTPSTAETFTWGTAAHDTYEGGRLYSNDLTALQGMKEGDILLIYNNKIERDADDTDHEGNIVTPWYGYDGYNQGLILQVQAAANYSNGGDVNDSRGLDGYVDVTFANGPIFSNKLEDPLLETTKDGDPLYNGGISTADYSKYMIENRAEGYRMESNIWKARKLGDADSFNQVEYRVEEGISSGAVTALSRKYNGDEAVVATDIAKFSIRLGLDVAPSVIAALSEVKLLNPDSLDGMVSRLDADAWTSGITDSQWGSRTEDEVKVMLGRLSLQAEVEFLQLGAEDKGQEAKTTTGDDGSSISSVYRKNRGFVQQYRLRNITPMILN